ncbi:hypothetical protein [Phaeobacter porticola]|uniref:Putative extracellular repeat protein, HAF family n=1 Tax=Phaeobacter porticola TaxID=1844006 RepID=A0A1L3I149_9RHOB|nr:hypothetical protein [Phaeobacter porticola]APG45832.1 putative extracellular repeat protein, HAF family [Phaeobacter porticola]
MFNNFQTLIASTLVSLVQLLSSPDVSAATCEAPVKSNIEGVVVCDLGVLKGGESSFAKAVSDDGHIVVGVSGSSEGERAFLWTEELGMLSLGVLPGGSKSRASGISADGSTVVGGSDSAAGWHAFLWRKDTGMVSLGEAERYTQTHAQAVSADGSVVVGSVGGTGDSGGKRAFRWTADSGITFIGTEDLHRDSAALGVSDDGKIIVGRVGVQAFRWTKEDGVVLLAPVQGEKLMYAHDASWDGSIVVGDASSHKRSKAFFWSTGGGSQLLLPPFKVKKAGARAISRLSEAVVGYVKGAGGGVAFIKEKGGPVELLGRLKDSGGYISSSASDVSADGSVVAGSSTGDLGHRAVIWKLSDQN